MYTVCYSQAVDPAGGSRRTGNNEQPPLRRPLDQLIHHSHQLRALLDVVLQLRQAFPSRHPHISL
jgi:hypothetical protein